MAGPTAAGRGWYPDPSGEHTLRFWDGSEWTDRVRSEDAAVTAPPEPPPAAKTSEPPSTGAPESPPLEPEPARPDGNRKRVVIAIGAIVAVIVVIFVVRAVASDGDSGGGGDAGPVGGGGGAGDLGTIETPGGTFTIEKVEVGSEIPRGCDPQDDFSCLAAEPGSQVVKVTFGGDELPDDVLDDPDIFIESGDGDRSPVVIHGFGLSGDGDESSSYIGFTPDESDRDFTLHWGSESIQLGK